MTSQTQINTARAIAEAVAKLPGIQSCIVDDWSDFGSFQLFASLKTARGTTINSYNHVQLNPEVNLRSLTFKIKQIMKLHPVIPEHIEHPRQQYESICGRPEFVGYNNDSSKITLTVRE